MTTARAGIYARISSDDTGEGLGVARQVADCEAEAQRRGWTVTDRFVDNDVSATRSKRRPEYQRMLTAAAAGHITGLIVWDVDRLTRTPRELEDVIDLADRVGLSLASVGGEIDLSTPQGRMTARIKGSVARHETEQMSRRIRRKFDDRAQAGSPHGFVAYGYRRDDVGRDSLEPAEAAVIGSTADRLLGGESLRSIVADLNAQGVPSPRGLSWSSTALRQVMSRARNAGLRRHRGQVIGAADWPAIYSEGVHDRVIALLTDPTRRSNKGATRRHLLSGIARCGRDGCNGTMIVNVGRVTETQVGTKRQPPAYVCQVCTKIRRKQSSVDEYVEAVMIARLSKPDALAALSADDPVETQRARDAVAEMEANLELAADNFAEGIWTGAQVTRITAKLRPQIERERAVIAASVGLPGLADLAGADAEKRWSAAGIDVRRAVVETLAMVTILPSGPGRSFDPGLIQIEWTTG